MQSTHTHRKKKKSLKKYKNKLHKRSSASLLANVLGKFCKFIFFLFFHVCAASLCPNKVTFSLQISSSVLFLLSVRFVESATSPCLGVKSAQ